MVSRVRPPKELVGAVHDCAEMIDAANVLCSDDLALVAEPLPSLLAECERLTDQVSGVPDPIRTLHHFACTGGTLISKCLACMPNVQLLSEVEPFSRLPGEDGTAFHPTDLIQLLRKGSRGVDAGLEAEVFLAGLRTLFADCQRRGLRLVLRDHTHSHYCVGETPVETPVLRDLVKDIAPVRPVVTVRHPLDSFLSMEKLSWMHFRPATLDEYCNRYMRFLDEYREAPLFRYEDFVAAPADVMESICDAFELPFTSGFEYLFGVHRLSGDSGRSAETIAARTRQPIPGHVAAQIASSGAYQDLCLRLGYALE